MGCVMERQATGEDGEPPQRACWWQGTGMPTLLGIGRCCRSILAARALPAEPVCCKMALFVPHCLQTSAKGSYWSWIHLTGNCPGCWLHSRRYIKFDTFHPAVSKGLPVTRVISRITLQVRTAGRAFCSWCSLCSKNSVIAAFWQQPWRSAWSLQGQQRSRRCIRLAVQMAQRSCWYQCRLAAIASGAVHGGCEGGPPVS